MTFRQDKGHRIQESGRTSGNTVPKLAASLQRYLTEGKISKKELKAIDDEVSQVLRERFSQIQKRLEQLKEHVPKNRGRDSLSALCTEMGKWHGRIVSGELNSLSSFIRASNLKQKREEIEEVLDIESELFNSLISFDLSLSAELKKASYEIPDVVDICKNAGEITELLVQREKILSLGQAA